LGLCAPVICSLGPKLTTGCYMFFLQWLLPEARMRQAGGSARQDSHQAHGGAQCDKQSQHTADQSPRTYPKTKATHVRKGSSCLLAAAKTHSL
jgi:hypothetical protein